ncbi:MAG: HAD-IC family P-type ATPase, partial [Anaerolineae bacterium]|nr:HAD-IC family P-type ATPase [Anaerolineae bacterium]
MFSLFSLGEGNMTMWYQKEVAEVAGELGTNIETGLKQAEIAQRLEKYGPNELIDRGGKSPWKILLEQLVGIMTIVLIVAAVVSVFLRDYEDAIAILAIVILNTILGFTQEYRAERAMAALKKMAVPVVRVRRDGRIQELSAPQLVPGDVVLLESGNLVPADGRVVESINLSVQEAVLTGESEPVAKITEALPQDSLTIGDQRNRAFMGTVVTYGRGSLLVTDTGMRTELGRIAELLQGVEQEPTPMQRRLEQLARTLAFAALVIVGIVFVLGLIRGEDLRLMFLTAISMAVAAVPEGLPTVVTIGLAIGAQAMLRRKALIRKLPAVEALGSVTVICSDKTGTLTENRMTVTYLDVANHQMDLKEVVQGFSPRVKREEATPALTEHPAISLMLTAGSLCNDAVLESDEERPGEYSSVGDPTEGALVIAAARGNLWKSELEKSMPRLSELPFDSDRKRMTTVHRLPQAGELAALGVVYGAHTDAHDFPYIAYTKGAVDGMLEVSSQVLQDGKLVPLTAELEERIRNANNRLAENGMRVLGVAYQMRRTPEANRADEPVEKDLIFIGMAGMIDPARPEVYEAVKTARTAGIHPIMITGDHPLTALSIARDLGIATTTHVVTGRELAEMDIARLQEVVKDTSVFARVSPEHKLKIVEALQKNGEIVAMTGDGVNDAPALKKADIGVAMGITGTDVSKEASEMVLLDDNFATIVAAVEEGRRIYDNIRKFIKYALGSNIGEILVMLVAPFFGMPLPLLPIQILWVNLVTDGLPGLALTVEKSERNTMRRPPFDPKESVFSRGLGRGIILMGILLGLITLGVAYWG